MSEVTRPADGQKFSVQIFWVAHLINNRLNRIAFGPFVDWVSADKERKAQPDPDNYLVMRTDSDIYVDDNRQVL